MECQKEENKQNCNCTYPGCSRKGICCECIRHHLKNRQLPGCCFNQEGEKTYDRSFEHFVKLVQENKV
ncbi:MAG: cytosolic protein [Nanoarchaeota archaeon]|nr:cytosolic protein [Nanoarchaeota archaeon]MBU1622567.1 cytosolic protein [Nanoarchaeota archaeon]MBU1973941.1 cytosolic protein [Nanoarchaeota archaeon]